MAGRILRRGALQDDMEALQETVDYAGSASATVLALGRADSARGGIPPPPYMDFSAAALRRQVSEGTAALYLKEEGAAAPGMQVDLMAAARPLKRGGRKRRSKTRRGAAPSGGGAAADGSAAPSLTGASAAAPSLPPSQAQLLLQMQPSQPGADAAAAVVRVAQTAAGTVTGQAQVDSGGCADQAAVLLSVAQCNGWSPRDALVVGGALGSSDVPLPQRGIALGDSAEWIAALGVDTIAQTRVAGTVFISPIAAYAAAKMSRCVDVLHPPRPRHRHSRPVPTHTCSSAQVSACGQAAVGPWIDAQHSGWHDFTGHYTRRA